MTGQWSDRSAMSNRKTLSPPDPMSYLRSLALRIWTAFWRREGSAGMDMWNAPMDRSRQPLTYRLMESVGLGGQRWHGSSWQRGIAESRNSRLSTLDRNTWRSGLRSVMRAASKLPGRGPTDVDLHLYLHVNQKSIDDDDDNDLVLLDQFVNIHNVRNLPLGPWLHLESPPYI